MNAETGGLAHRLRAAVGARPGEGLVVLWSSAYYFLVLCAYYVIRPIRDDMGAASGAENLAWLFTGTLAGMLLLHPLYAALVSKLPRNKFIALANRFFILNLVLFYIAFRLVDPSQSVWVGRVFFIWTSVFNLFVVSVFWSLIADVFQPGQGKRLFGIVAVGGTVGAMLGSTITTTLVGALGALNLMLVSAVILELAVHAARLLDRNQGAMLLAAAADSEADSAAESDTASNITSGRSPQAAVSSRSATSSSATASSASTDVIGGGIMEGIKHVFASPYLLGVASLILFYSISSTFLYFQQVDIVSRVFGSDSVNRTRVFGSIDLAVNILTLLAQLFLTGRVMKYLGIGFALAFLPFVTLIGFGAMGAQPALAVLVVFLVIRRAGNFAIQRPAREALYTVVARTDKYKAKNFSDTFVYRLGDQVGAWAYTGMAFFGLGLSGLSFTMVPFAACWVVLTLWLGKQFRAKERAQAR